MRDVKNFVNAMFDFAVLRIGNALKLQKHFKPNLFLNWTKYTMDPRIFLLIKTNK